MINKKLVFLFLIFFSLHLISAINLTVSSRSIQDAIINDADDPASFEFTIVNNEEEGVFEIFSFERFKIEPNEFEIGSKETKKAIIHFYPEGSIKTNIGHLEVPYFFREKFSSETQEGSIFMELVDFNKIFDLGVDDINPDSDSLTLNFYNVEKLSYENVNVVFSGDFFNDKEAKFSLVPYEKKIFSIPINKDALKKLVFGVYPIKAVYNIDGRTATIIGYVEFLEKSSLTVTDDKKGFIINSRIIEKHNTGNILTVADVYVGKNIISRLFTTFSVEPLRVQREGIYVNYFWQKELQPDESLEVKVTTNWTFPLLILIGVIVILYLFNLYISTDVVVRKNVSFVKTKGGEFALRVTIKVKAKKFVEKVVLYDRLPGMAKLYEKFGNSPDKLDSGRLEWNIGYLGEDEERVFNYVLYSKMKVVGKFELPSSTVVYELNGKVHEAYSNRAFFINEVSDI